MADCRAEGVNEKCILFLYGFLEGKEHIIGQVIKSQMMMTMEDAYTTQPKRTLI